MVQCVLCEKHFAMVPGLGWPVCRKCVASMSRAWRAFNRAQKWTKDELEHFGFGPDGLPKKRGAK